MSKALWIGGGLLALAVLGGWRVPGVQVGPDGTVITAPGAGPAFSPAIGEGFDRTVDRLGDEAAETISGAVDGSDALKALVAGGGAYATAKGAKGLRDWRATPPTVSVPPTTPPTTPPTAKPGTPVTQAPPTPDPTAPWSPYPSAPPTTSQPAPAPTAKPRTAEPRFIPPATTRPGIQLPTAGGLSVLR